MSSTLQTKQGKLGYIIMGTVSLALGLIGVLVPVLPTTPFVLFSAWCYYQGSERLHVWLVKHPFFGPIVEEYGDSEGMSRESKVKAIVLTWLAVLLTAVFVLDSMVMRGVIVGFACIGTVVLIRLKSRE